MGYKKGSGKPPKRWAATITWDGGKRQKYSGIKRKKVFLEYFERVKKQFPDATVVFED